MAGNHPFLHAIKPERQDVSTGMLSRHRLVVSDCVGVTGIVTGIGIPAWADGHQATINDANVVEILMKSGCKLVGKTQVDDFGTSISGKNPFLARLTHPTKLGCRVGGSASGCAVALANGDATIAIANDCCGGVLIPASYCHLFGYRPSPDMVDLRGVVPLSPSFDAVGFMTKQLPILQQVVEKCWRNPVSTVRLKRINCALTLFEELLPTDALHQWKKVMSTFDFPRKDISDFSKLILTQANHIHTVILGREIDLEYGAWLDKEQPNLSDETAQFLAQIRGISFKEFVETKKKRKRLSEMLYGLLASGELLMIPTSPGATVDEKSIPEGYVNHQRQLYAIAEVAGFAQLTLPLVMVGGVPMGVSLLARRGEDKLLFDAATRWFM